MDGRKDSWMDGDSYIPLLNFFFGGGGVIIHHALYIEKKYTAIISLEVINQFTQSNYKVALEIED